MTTLKDTLETSEKLEESLRQLVNGPWVEVIDQAKLTDTEASLTALVALIQGMAELAKHCHAEPEHVLVAVRRALFMDDASAVDVALPLLGAPFQRDVTVS